MESLDQKITKLLTGYPYIQLVIMFGSLSRDSGRVDSDLDLAVAGTSVLTAQQKIDLVEDLALVIGRPVDLIDLRSAEGLILAQALTTGRIIYCIDRSLYAELIIKMLYNQADMMPYRKLILEKRRKAWINP